jgi:hypothetical protein
MSRTNQTGNERGSSDSLKLDSLRADQLNAVSQSYFQAAKEGNLKQLALVLAPEFHFIDEHGKVFAAAGCLGSLEDAVSRPESDPDPTRPIFDKEKIRVNSFDVKDVNTQRIGEVVIETMLYSDNISVQPPKKRTLVTFDRNFRWTNIWAQSDGTFKMVLTQITSLGAGTASAPSKLTLLIAWSIIATILVIVLGVILLSKSTG